METPQVCPECGAVWLDGTTCQDCFHQMLYWENENQRLLEVHHLAVLCYYLQHPSLYSPEGLDGAKHLLTEFMEQGITPREVRQSNRSRLGSGKRMWKIKGGTNHKGLYENPILWKMTAADVVVGGMDNYCESVKAWARSVIEALKASGNLS